MPSQQTRQSGQMIPCGLESGDDIISSSFTCYAHRACLEQRFEPPHFQQDGSPHPNLLVQVDAFLKSHL